MIRCFWTISTLIGAILMMASQAWSQEVPFKHKFRWCGADDPDYAFPDRETRLHAGVT